MDAIRGIRLLDSGQLEVRLEAEERDLLRTIAAELRLVVVADASPAVRERLFPRAYEDSEQEREYRELMSQTLADQRLAAIEAFAATLDAGEAAAQVWAVQLSAEQADAWLSAINDARLTLGAVLGIADEADHPEPTTPAAVALSYLGWLQEDLLDALSGSLPPA